MPKSSKSVVTILDSDIRVDKDTGYICITDIANMKDGIGKIHVRNWTRRAASIDFFTAWEMKHNPAFKGSEFDTFRMAAGGSTFQLSATELTDAGATAIFSRRGRYGGTYCHIDWTLHFTNWLDPFFYVETVEAFRVMSDKIYGRTYLHKRLAHEIERERVAERFKLVVHGIKHTLPDKADILNIAMWNLTAKEWRIKTGIVDPHANMRDFATTEELKVLSDLQVTMRNLQEDQYTAEEKLFRLCNQANELLVHYCNTAEKAIRYNEAKEKRGW